MIYSRRHYRIIFLCVVYESFISDSDQSIQGLDGKHNFAMEGRNDTSNNIKVNVEDVKNSSDTNVVNSAAKPKSSRRPDIDVIR